MYLLVFFFLKVKDWKGVAKLIEEVAEGAEDSRSRRGARRSWLGEKACLVCVTKAKAFQEF